MNPYTLSPDLNGEGLHIGVVRARFNEAVGQAELDACLAELEADRADAVRGAYLDGYSYEELASRYGVPLNTMRTRLRRSLIKLKECLTR